MLSTLENNLLIFCASYVLAAGAWLAAGRVASLPVRRALHVSIGFLVFPIVYLGHPLLYYQVWMLLLAYATEPNLPWLLLSLLTWSGLILLFLIFRRRTRQR